MSTRTAPSISFQGVQKFPLLAKNKHFLSRKPPNGNIYDCYLRTNSYVIIFEHSLSCALDMVVDFVRLSVRLPFS